MRRKKYPLKKLQEAMERLERGKLEKVNVTNPESRLIKDSQKVIQPSYNGQIIVDKKEQVIVAADISQNATNHAEFKPLVGQAERNLGALPKEGSTMPDTHLTITSNLQRGRDLNLYARYFLESLDEKEKNEKNITRASSVVTR